MKIYMLSVLAENPEAHERFRAKAVQYAHNLISISGHTTYQTDDGSVTTEPVVTYYVATETETDMSSVLAIAKMAFDRQLALLVAQLGPAYMGRSTAIPR